MMQRKLAIVAAIVLAAAALIVVPALMSAALSVGSKAPGFQLSGFSGKTVSLADYTNKPTLVVFWASWCPHCVRELPVLDRLYKDLHPKGANFVGVNLDSPSSNGKKLVGSKRISFPMAVGNASVAEKYDVTGIPAIFVIGKGGAIKAKYAGEVDETTIRADFAKLGVK